MEKATASRRTFKRYSFCLLYSYAFFELMNVSVESGETCHQVPSYDCFHTQSTYCQAQLALVVIPRKAVGFRARFANERANVYRLLLRSLKIL